MVFTMASRVLLRLVKLPGVNNSTIIYTSSLNHLLGSVSKCGVIFSRDIFCSGSTVLITNYGLLMKWIVHGSFKGYLSLMYQLLHKEIIFYYNYLKKIDNTYQVKGSQLGVLPHKSQFTVTLDSNLSFVKGVLHLWALFLKTFCIFSKNKATLDKVTYASGQKCSKELKNHSFISVEAIVVKVQ